MIFLQVEFLSPLFDEVLQLRTQVLRTPLAMTFESQDIAAEYTDLHFAACDNSWNLLGTLLMRSVNETIYKMRQVAVSPDRQGQGIGQYMVREVERWSLQHNITDIVLSARIEAVPFYKRLHYTAQGPPYLEIGIQHMHMSKKLTPPALEE